MTNKAEGAADAVRVASKVLGPLRVSSGQIYSFPDEIHGFSGASTFALLDTGREGFFWLQSLDFDALTFLLIDPLLVVEGYRAADAEPGGLPPEDPSRTLVLAIVTLPREPGEQMTVNLQGPIVFDLRERLGRQIVVESPLGLRHPLRMDRGA